MKNDKQPSLLLPHSSLMLQKKRWTSPRTTIAIFPPPPHFTSAGYSFLSPSLPSPPPDMNLAQDSFLESSASLMTPVSLPNHLTLTQRSIFGQRFPIPPLLSFLKCNRLTPASLDSQKMWPEAGVLAQHLRSSFMMKELVSLCCNNNGPQQRWRICQMHPSSPSAYLGTGIF